MSPSPVKATSPPKLRSRINSNSNCDQMNISEIVKSLKTIDISLNNINKRVMDLDKKVDNIEITLNVKYNEVLSKLDNLEVNMKTKISQLETELSSCKTNLNQLYGALDKRLDQTERMLNSTNIQVSGIPTTENENLMEYIKSISDVINFKSDVPFVESVYRIPSKHAGITPTIMVKFLNKGQKDIFLLKYLKFKNLQLNNLGCFNATSRIYINEHLTKRNYAIHKELLQFKRNGTIVQLFSRNGLIYVRKPNQMTTTAIFNALDIDSLFNN